MGNCNFLHKLVYTSAYFDRKDLEELKNTFHKLFEKCQRDLVLLGHTHYYQRFLPLSYNNDNATTPFVMDQNNTEYGYPILSVIIYISTTIFYHHIVIKKVIFYKPHQGFLFLIPLVLRQHKDNHLDLVSNL